MSFLVPRNDRETKVNNVRRWEQGFKVYAAVYSRFNPHRGAEIWQYMHTINLAASSYSWENVAYYDFMFRQQTAKHPERSWKKINNQLWSLAMRDPISHRNNNYNSSNNSNFRSESRDPRDHYCWRFNKGTCKQSATECRFEHKCAICNGSSHGKINCYKRKRSMGEGNSSNGNQPQNQSASQSEHNRKTSNKTRIANILL